MTGSGLLDLLKCYVRRVSFPICTPGNSHRRIGPGFLGLPLPRGRLSQAQAPAALEKGLGVHLTSNVAGVPSGVQKAALQQTHVGRAGEKGNHHNGVNGVDTGSARDALQPRGDLAPNPAGFGLRCSLGGTQSLGDKRSSHCVESLEKRCRRLLKALRGIKTVRRDQGLRVLPSGLLWFRPKSKREAS